MPKILQRFVWALVMYAAVSHATSPEFKAKLETVSAAYAAALGKDRNSAETQRLRMEFESLQQQQQQEEVDPNPFANAASYSQVEDNEQAERQNLKAIAEEQYRDLVTRYSDSQSIKGGVGRQSTRRHAEFGTPTFDVDDTAELVQHIMEWEESKLLEMGNVSELNSMPALQRPGRKLQASPPYRECFDRGWGCEKWSSLGYCTHEMFKAYMHSNCAVTCRTCSCHRTGPPPPSESPPPPECTQCCSSNEDCETKYPNYVPVPYLIQCVMDASVDEESGWPLDYSMQWVGGPGYDLEGHPFRQVQHIDIANWKPRTGSNEFPLPRRATMMVAQGEGNSSKYWLFGGIGVIPGQPAPVSVLRDVGICSVSGGQGRLSSCDSDNDGQFDDFCDQGSKCLASNLPNGGCGEQGACTGVTGTQITLEYLNDMWSYDPIKMMWTRYWAMSTRPTHRAFHSMVIIDELIAIYGGLSPFCYEYCKDVWILNITKGEWQSDKYQRGGTGSGTGDEVLDAKLTGKSITRPLTWSYGNPEDPLWKLHAFNDGYRYEEYGERSRVPGSEGVGGRPFPTAQQHPGKVLPPYDPKYLIPERRYQHVAVAWKQAGRWDMTNWSDYQRDSAGNVEPCRNYSQPIFNLTVGYTGPQPMSNYTPYLCNRTYGKYVWRRPHRWMIIYAGYGGAKKTADITVQKQTYYLSDTWKYDLDTMLWYKMDPYLRSGKAPGERYGHSAVMYVDTMYVFGGRRNFAPVQFTDFVYEPNKLVYNDIWGYNIPNNTWFLVTPTPNNERPHERHGQRAVLWEDIMIVFGGYYDPVQYYQDVWHYNITSNIWRNKHVNGLIPANRMQYGVAMWNKLMVFFGGYGSDCTLINTGSPGVYCRPDGPAYYLGDTWHYDLTICPNGCVGNGTCHYGSCICGPGSDGLDCSNFTCPDCTSMVADPMQSMPCELWDSNEQPVTLIQNPDPYNPVTEWHHIGGPGLPVELSNLTVLDGNCYYDFGIQEKVCRDCSLRGQCDNPTGNCVCDPMFSNFDCSYMACPHPLCNNGGVCLLSGRCVCRYAFFEMDCSINFECPGDCSYQGMCEPGGVCRCYEGFYGVDCSIAIATSGADAVAATSKLYMLLLASAVTWWTCQTQGP